MSEGEMKGFDYLRKPLGTTSLAETNEFEEMMNNARKQPPAQREKIKDGGFDTLGAESILFDAHRRSSELYTHDELAAFDGDLTGYEERRSAIADVIQRPRDARRRGKRGNY